MQLNQGVTTDIFIRGGWFTNETTVVIEGITINSLTIQKEDTMVLNITTPNQDGFHNVEVTNQGGTTIFENGIEVKLSEWVDLRQNGDSFQTGTDIRFRGGMSLNRSTTGMKFNGGNPWSSWVKFESLKWNRGENKTLQWIMDTPTANMMIGIGSDSTDENSGAQYIQGEVLAYFTNSNSFWGLYGNNGTIGSTGNQSNFANFSANSVLKLKFEGDGGLGSTFSMYQLPSSDPSDWDDESNLITSFQIGGTLNPDEGVIMPFIISRADDVQDFIAIKIE